jgi:methylmalonyl-CoA mutase
MENVFGRHRAVIQSIQGVYARRPAADPKAARARAMVAAFEEADGGRPRILVAKMGQDGHDRGQKVIASGLRRPRLRRRDRPAVPDPRRGRAQAVENDVHVVGASSLAAGHLTLVPELKAELEKLGRSDIMMVVGGVIPPQDFQALLDAGAASIFPPGTVIAEAAIEVLEKLNVQLGYTQGAAA